MRWLDDLSIRRKFLAILVVAGVPVVLLAGVVLVAYDQSTYRQKLARDLGISAEMLGLNATAPLVFDDPEEGGRILATLSANEAIEVGIVWDRRGIHFASHRRAALRPDFGPGRILPDTTYYRDGHLQVWRKIRHGDETIGTIFLQAGTEELTRRLAATILMLLVVMVVATAVFVRVASRLQNSMSEPLLRLARVTQDVGAASYPLRPIPVTGRDEIGLLTQRFNDMIEQINERDRDIQHYQQWLEVRVEERTRELTLAKTQAEEASRAKSEFLANMSHELRTPLHGVLGFAELGSRRAEHDAKLREYYERIHTSGSRLLRLVNDLLDLAKLEAGRREFSLVPSPVDELVASVIDELNSLFSTKGLALRLQPGERVIASVDREAVMHVARNLIGNAIKFSPADAEIEVSVRSHEGGALLVVQDRGPGIPEDELESIFDKFVQSRRTKTQAGGTGLGLAICRELVTGMGGRIWAENRPGGGAALFVQLQGPSADESGGPRGALPAAA